MSLRGKKRSLAEQLAELSNPKPVIFNPEDDIDTTPKICEFDEYEEGTCASFGSSNSPVRSASAAKRRRRDAPVLETEEDARYAGQTISRNDLDQLEGGSTQKENVPPKGKGANKTSGKKKGNLLSESEGDTSSVDTNSDSELSAGELSEEEEECDDNETQKCNQGDLQKDEATAEIFLASLQEDIEKGKAAKDQIDLWQSLLESRIRLHKVLGHCNRMPQFSSLPAFKNSGTQQLEQALSDCQAALMNLLENLLELQQLVLLKNKETSSVVDETASDWGGASRNRTYESCIAKVHDQLKPYRDSTITKWSNKTRLASGKVTSKAFIRVDHSVLAQIEHVLKDRPRLIKRTQLRRSVYHVLGKDIETEGSSTEEGDQPTHDMHLKDYDEEIYDDDDFYHQLLRELIERKMNFTETSDPIAMGRQWLELQKLRTKVKRTVDTRASKGRKIRYDIHPKLVGFMAPIPRGTFSDTSRNDLFSSLFGTCGVKDCDS